jgi:EpsI family protein
VSTESIAASPRAPQPIDRADPASDRRRPLWALLVAFAFLPTWLGFPGRWLDSAEHGFAAAALALWLLWRDRERLATSSRPLPLALIAVAGLSLLWLAAFVLNVQVVQQGVLPLLLLAWLIATAGLAPARAAAPIAGAFLLAVPFWDVLTRPLQSLTVLANALLLRIARIDATIDGDLIRIPAGTFWVAEGCAGIDYFQIGLLVGVAYALLFLRTWRARVMVIAASVVGVVVMNWLRVFGLIVVGHVTDMQSPLIRDHGTYGWILFAVAQALFLAVARRIDLAEERTLAAVSATSADAASVPPSGPVRLRPLVVATSIAISGPLLHVLLAGGTRASANALAEQARVIPPAGWTEAPRDLSLFRPAFSGADLAAQTHWQRGDARVQVDRLLYAEQRQGKELIQYDNAIAPDSLRAGEGRTRPLGTAGVEAQVTVVRTPAGPRLVWSWYRVAGQVTASPTSAKLLELLAFVRRASASELVAVSASCERPDCGDAGSDLQAFILGSSLLSR